MKRTREYVRTHHSKKVREERVDKEMNQGVDPKGLSMEKVKERKWTLNRSPHGNKTAREQFGRQVWKRRRKRDEEGRLQRKRKMRKNGRYVDRKGK